MVNTAVIAAASVNWPGFVFILVSGVVLIVVVVALAGWLFKLPVRTTRIVTVTLVALALVGGLLMVPVQ
jgi:hypothetical protein